MLFSAFFLFRPEEGEAKEGGDGRGRAVGRGRGPEKFFYF